MALLLNRVKVVTATTGTGTVTLGAVVTSPGEADYQSWADAGAVNGATYAYLIEDGSDWELGQGVYTSSGTTLTRATVTASRIAGTSGTTKLTLSGFATVSCVARVDDFTVPPRTHFQKQSSAAISNNTFADYSWVSGELIVDDIGAWVSGTPTKFIPPTGWTRAKVLVHAAWAANNTGFRWVGINLTGNTLQWQEKQATGESGITSQTKWLTGLTTSDYITIQFAQTSGGNLNLLGAAGANAWASFVEIEWAK